MFFDVLKRHNFATHDGNALNALYHHPVIGIKIFNAFKGYQIAHGPWPDLEAWRPTRLIGTWPVVIKAHG